MKIKLLVISLMIGLTSAHAQEWPQKQVKVIVGGTPGSTADLWTRTIFDQVSKQTGKNIVVENRGGAAGTIAGNAIVKSEPDGHTLFVNTITHTVAPLIQKSVRYNVETDFTNICGLVTQPFVLTASVRWKNIDEFVKYGKENPGKLNWASPGLGSSGHLLMEKFSYATNIKMVHIPYRGSPEALTDILSGQVDIFPSTIGHSLSVVKEGHANNLVVTSPKRSPITPDVPTLNESGIKNSNYIYWLGLFGPAKINPIIVENINLEVQRAMSSSEVKSKLNELGYEPIKMSPSEFDTFVRNEIKQHKEIISRSKMTME